VNFDLGPDELALRDGIRELCGRRFPMETVRAGFDRSAWRDLGQAGVFSLRLPESDGGVGLGITEAVIVFHELGAALVPGPLVGTHLAASIDPEAAVGDRVITVLDTCVAYAGDADGAIDVGSSSIVTDLGGEDVEPLDPLTPIRRLAEQTETDAESAMALEGKVLTAALSSGIASRTVDLAVAYARERVQFDKPIGSFQAVKHICADMLVRAEVARAAVDAAGVLLDEGSSDSRTAVASAKLLASEAAVANAKSCIQVHGGMGFTWEVDAHLYVKRAAVLATQFGGIDRQSEEIAAAL
jgi:alkylation response protein AidB-like acyl-CoA dehydrogenase